MFPNKPDEEFRRLILNLERRKIRMQAMLDMKKTAVKNANTPVSKAFRNAVTKMSYTQLARQLMTKPLSSSQKALVRRRMNSLNHA